MAVLNVTPDSFSDAGLFADPEAAIAHGRRLIAGGADILDIGGESTRPGHVPIDAATECARVLPVIRALAAESAVPISIDTSKAEVARAALEAGAAIVNDVRGGRGDPAIAGVAARFGAPIVLMHNSEPISPHLDIMAEVIAWLSTAIGLAGQAGVAPESIIVDPGIGFGKTPEQNLILIRDIARLRSLGRPVLLGVSRKSIIGRVTGRAVPAERLAGTLAAHLHGAAEGVSILRVHDVPAHVDALRMRAAIRAGRIGSDP